jgi:hypothetical protein
VEQILDFYQQRRRIIYKKDKKYVWLKIPKFIEIASNWTCRTTPLPTEVPAEVPTEAPTAREAEVEEELDLSIDKSAKPPPEAAAGAPNPRFAWHRKWESRSMLAYLKILDNHGRRIPVSQFMSAYESAGTGRHLFNWGTSSMGPNSAIFGSLNSIRSRSRNLVMNTPQASGAIDSFVSNMIGQGITPSWQIDDRDLKEQIQELWVDWVKESDSDGTSSFYGQQSLVARSMMESGNVVTSYVIQLSRLRGKKYKK